jgi:hypothetical protein
MYHICKLQLRSKSWILGYLIRLVITTAPIFSPWKYQHSSSRTGCLDALHNLLTNYILCKLQLWNECALPINWTFFDWWLPASSNNVSSITWAIERNCLRRFCSMFCNVITFLGVLYCNHTGWGIWSSAQFAVLHIRLMPTSINRLYSQTNKIVWSIVLYSFSYLHTTYVICCAIVSHFHLMVHHYVLFIWGSV